MENASRPIPAGSGRGDHRGEISRLENGYIGKREMTARIILHHPMLAFGNRLRTMGVSGGQGLRDYAVIHPHELPMS